jgi:Protein of unknown function (DUF1573)
MKKVYAIVLTMCIGSFAFAQTVKVTPAVKEEKVKTAVKPEADMHAGHNHGPLPVVKEEKVKMPVKPEVDMHAGHNHGTQPTTAVTAVAPVADMAKPIAEDNLGLTEMTYNFGKIPQGKPVTHDFIIANTGKTELKLDNVQASCGCTTPVWQPGPYKSGEKAMITVGYNAAAAGAFNKTVTITYNNGLSKVINITGEVWQAPATPAPENKSVQILKGGN